MIKLIYERVRRCYTIPQLKSEFDWTVKDGKHFCSMCGVVDIPEIEE